jgi:hypothetical protein
MLAIAASARHQTSSQAAEVSPVSPGHKTQHIIFVMTDGLRWQEVFNGAEESLMNKKNGKVKKEEELKKTYWRDSTDERRQVLMPFVWQVIAKQGQIFGNRFKGSDAYVTNHMFFSYPGYNETLCGFPDDERIHSNDNVPNPNVTVLEWLKNRQSFDGNIAAFGAWDVIANVFSPERSRLTANAGYVPLSLTPSTPELDLVNRFKVETPRIWEDEPFDAVPFYTAVEYMKLKHPKVLYISLGETDEWAHAGQYTEYLDSAHRVDTYLRTLWELAVDAGISRQHDADFFSRPWPGQSAPKMARSWPKNSRFKIHLDDVPRSRHAIARRTGENLTRHPESNRRDARGISWSGLQRKRDKSGQANRGRIAALKSYSRKASISPAKYCEFRREVSS